MKIVVDAPENEIYCLMADYVNDVYRSIAPLNEVLDEIKAEIEQDAVEGASGTKFIFVNRVNQIIDKYKSESER